jgi:SPP1 gp7 family putative phage head morphogenesis protein
LVKEQNLITTEDIDKAIELKIKSFVNDITNEMSEQLKKGEDYKAILELELPALDTLRKDIALAYIFGKIKEVDIQEFEEIKKSYLEIAFNLPFDEAINYLAGLYSGANLDLTPLGENLRELTWIIEENTLINLQNDLLKSLIKVLETGQSYKDWVDNFVHVLDTTSSYLELVYRQNIYTAYAKGTYDQQIENIDNRPYVVYDSVMDGRTSDICESLNDKVFEVGSTLHRKYSPPNHFNCYDKKTLVMTEEGFKLFKDVKVGEKCLTINKETQDLEYSEVIRTYKKFEKEIYHIKNKTVDMAVSKDHPFVGLRKIDRGKYKEIIPFENLTLDKIHSESKMFASSEWKGNGKSNIKIGNSTFDYKSFAGFMAIYLSDGSYTEGKRYISIARERIKNKDNIIKVLEKLDNTTIKVWKSKIGIYNDDLINYVDKFGKTRDKYVPKEILNADKDVIQEFIKYYLMCDGSETGENKYWDGYKCRTIKCLFTTSEKLMSGLVECVIKSGKSASVTNKQPTTTIKKDGSLIVGKHQLYIIHINDGKYRGINKKMAKIVKYNDFVYDVEVEKNNTLLTMRNGKVIWGSNCRSTFISLTNEDLNDLNLTLTEKDPKIDLKGFEGESWNNLEESLNKKKEEQEEILKNF